ncbi:MAG: ATP-binding protein, partial [Clostridia bacterium]|nr:ATP-binding protein [Clostridia bacterium]
MNNYVNQLKVLRNLENNRLVYSLLVYRAEKNPDAYNNLLYEIYAASAETHLLATVQNAVLHDINAFSVGCATRKTISPFLRNAYLSDLKIITDAFAGLDDGEDFSLGEPLRDFNCTGSLLADNLEAFYRRYGYGQFLDGKVFEYRDGRLAPVTDTADISLEQLKNYRTEKSVIENNVKNFLEGLPFSHMLLYGDRGTGKSSTVHAMLNAYSGRGLKLIELDKSELPSIKSIKQQVTALPLKFILFIDDLTL